MSHYADDDEFEKGYKQGVRASSQQAARDIKAAVLNERARVFSVLRAAAIDHPTLLFLAEVERSL